MPNHNARIYSSKYNKKILTIYGEPYFGLEQNDKCGTITVSLPYSVNEELEKYCIKNNISRSRYIRILIENDLGIRWDV